MYYLIAVVGVLLSLIFLYMKPRSKTGKKILVVEEEPKVNITPSVLENVTKAKRVLMDVEDLGSSLIPKTRKRMKKENWSPLSETEIVLHQKQLEDLGMPSFKRTIVDHQIDFFRLDTTVFQMNIGLYCNQACSHCHVDSSPSRKEMMSKAVVDRCISIIKNSPSVKTVDITGGAPELNQQFRYLVELCTELDIEVIDRCNLTVLLEPYQEDLAQFLADNKVRIVASLPCYLEKNVSKQRGDEIFERSIRALQILNDLGYGQGGDLRLDLVYNPTGLSLPPPQKKLEEDYKRILKADYDIDFDSLFCITNMPINRFLNSLAEQGKVEEYMNLLIENFNPVSCEAVMCRNYVSIKWDGSLYDCDFNQQMSLSPQRPINVWDIESTSELLDVGISTRNHCFGCTAGAGSSCQGTTA